MAPPTLTQGRRRASHLALHRAEEGRVRRLVRRPQDGQRQLCGHHCRTGGPHSRPQPRQALHLSRDCCYEGGRIGAQPGDETAPVSLQESGAVHRSRIGWIQDGQGEPAHLLPGNVHNWEEVIILTTFSFVVGDILTVSRISQHTFFR